MMSKITYLWHHLMNIFVETAIIIFEICYLKTNNKNLMTIIYVWVKIMKADLSQLSFRIKNLTTVSN